MRCQKPVIHVLLLVICCYSTYANNRPVIGIMAQPTDSSLSPFGSQYLVASYVKWIESGGARVVPILYNNTRVELRNIFAEISGIVFPGGHCGFHDNLYGNTSWYLMQLAQEANDNGDHFPIWGTCQGFQQLVQFGSGQMEPSVIQPTTGTEGLLVPLEFTNFGLTNSRIISNVTSDVRDALKDLPVTINLHHFSALTATVEEEGSELHSFFSVVANNYDSEGKKFVSMIEARHYPFFGSQFHGEKNSFEWDQGWEANDTAHLAHGKQAVGAMQYLSSFFVDQARFCSHVWNEQKPPAPLIRFYNAQNTVDHSSSKWDLCYIF